ncbi:hypothetical protein OHB41_49565 [Streptomyces sp. NBC_01571]|uniref:hypothetical protein n=1 Tax=Streptomyces sp. NBC_01571 TaxID=2975883 RepID=UPI00225A249A|nr:hypothetical protein [Streptomyces sp. NBC_01571]MCX4581011.1 hypothetical protein [Streptomyces sp. NBC_01571]
MHFTATVCAHDSGPPFRLFGKHRPEHGAHMDKVRTLTNGHLRKRIAGHGRSVQDHILHGAEYSLGSGAVSSVIVWVQSCF